MESTSNAGSDLSGIRVERHGQVGYVYLSRPPVNAVNDEMLSSIATVFGAPATYFGRVTALALFSDGEHFSAGHDRNEAHRILEPSYLRSAAERIASIHNCILPVVSGVSGAAAGTGLILAAAADLMVIDPRADFWLPEVELGILGGAGYARRVLPQPVVRLLALTGRHISGAMMIELGAGLPPDPGTSVQETAAALADIIASRRVDTISAARQILAMTEHNAVDLHLMEMETSTDLAGKGATTAM